MLSKMDDYPIHQTPEPIARPASSDRNVYDRYWFNGYQDDGAFYFGIGAALYPNLEIMDCGFSIVIDGEQHAFHALAPRAEGAHRSRVGPFADRDPRADEEPARDDRRQRDRHRRRSALDRAHRQHRGGLPALRAPHRPHGRDALQPVRLLGRRDPLRADARCASIRRACTAPRIAAGASGRSATRRRPARRRSCRAASRSSGRRCTGAIAARTSASSRPSTACRGTSTAWCVPSTRTRTRSRASRIRASSCSRRASTRSTSCPARAARAPRGSR